MRRLLAILAFCMLWGGSAADAQITFIPGDRGIPPEAYSNWHGFAPANKWQWLHVSFTGGNTDTVLFGWQMDYMDFFVTSAPCSIRAVIDPTYFATGALAYADTANWGYVPAGASMTIPAQWIGVLVKGIVSGGTLDGIVYGRTY